MRFSGLLAFAAGLACGVVAAQTANPNGFGERRYDYNTPASRSGWIRVPRVTGRITSHEIGLVINTADPYSVEIGEFYARARALAPEQVLRVALPRDAALPIGDFQRLAAAIDAHFGDRAQALALAWTTPYAVACNSITGALALGFDAALCERPCAPSLRSPYFDSATIRTYTDHRLRPAMLLAAPSMTSAKAMIRRGVAADGSLAQRGPAPANVWFVTTDDVVRSVRSRLFPPAGGLPELGVDIHVAQTQSIGPAQRVLIYETGLANVDGADVIDWLPGALADHLTSFGGVLDSVGGQMPAIDWIGAGATASYGTVSEPCSHLQKFPHPQVLLLNYLQGASAIEAYWKSVAWPQQGVFVGEPLAAPFARP